MNITRKLKTVSAIYDNQGLRGLSKEMLSRFCECSEFVALQRDLTLAAPEIHCDLLFQLKRIDDATFQQFKHMPYPFSRHYQYRVEYGQRSCYGAFIGDHIAALMWPLLQADNATMVSKWRYLLPDEARISSIWTDPQYRGSGLMGACIEKFATYLKAHGFRYLYAFTWVENYASIRLHEKLGFQNVGSIHRYSFRWQKDGHGIYIRKHLPRIPLAKLHPPGELELPEIVS